MDPGTQLGPYEIKEPLGKGGMGEVYRAHDPNLRRDVAIKLLPQELAADEERLGRLKREARSLAALNHPHIATVHGFEEHDGTSFIVMELVDGETLAEKLEGGLLPVDQALEFGIQIAKALEAAHQRGIVHRDLKPSNVKITPSGEAKVLDFGLAKPLREGMEEAGSRLPTATVEATRTGVVMGTAAYMSPEQARGEEVDERTDIWALGCLLYEMLSGKRAFRGDTASDVLAAVLTSEPDWSALPSDVHSGGFHLLRRCLAKDPRDRFHHVADVRIAQEDLERAAKLESRPQPRPAGRWRRAFLAAGLLLLGVVAGMILAPWMSSDRTPPLPSAVARTVELPEGARLPDELSFAISPDGRTLVFSAAFPEGKKLFLQPLDRFEPTAIGGTDGGDWPFFSPDGSSIGFLAGTSLKRVSVDGGDPLVVTEVPSGELFGATWLESGDIVYSPGVAAGLWRVSASGGAPEPVTTPDTESGERGHWKPRPLPGGQSVLFEIDYAGRSVVTVLSVADGERIELADGTAPHYLATGHLLFRRGRAFLLAPFDPAGPRLLASPEPVDLKVMDPASFSLSSTGTLVVGPRRIAADEEGRVVWVNRAGDTESVVGLEGAGALQLSPDGHRIAFFGRGSTIHIYDTRRGTIRTLPPEGGNTAPVWSHDGTELIFHSTQKGRRTLYRLSLASEQGDVLLESRGSAQFPTSWSPDGRFLLYYNQHPRQSRDIWVLPLEGDEEPFPFIASRYNESAATFSPDGRWVAYVSNRSGRDEVYLTDFPERRTVYQVSSDGGLAPLWASDGTELFYRTGRAVYAVEVDAGEEAVLARPERLFEGTFAGPIRDVTGYGVSSAGKFLMQEEAGAERVSLQVTIDWARGLGLEHRDAPR